MELEEIAQREKFILFDNSINSLEDPFKQICNKRRYSDIKLKDMRSVQKTLSYLTNFLESTNSEISTIDQVTKEFNSLEKKCDKKAKEYDKIKKIEKSRSKKITNKYQKEYYKTKSLLQSVLQKVDEKKIIIKQRIYNDIYNSVLELDKLYPDFCGDESNIYKKLGIKKNIKTDQYLIAAVFYVSVFHHKPYALITKDRGLFKLALKFHKFIYLDDSDICKFFSKILFKNPVKIYLPNPPESSNYYKKLCSEKLYKGKSRWREKKELKKLKEKDYKVIEIKPFQTSS